jgi:hypothetical protein
MDFSLACKWEREMNLYPACKRERGLNCSLSPVFGGEGWGEGVREHCQIQFKLITRTCVTRSWVQHAVQQIAEQVQRDEHRAHHDGAAQHRVHVGVLQ